MSIDYLISSASKSYDLKPKHRERLTNAGRRLKKHYD
jgi:hypothetical protein